MRQLGSALGIALLGSALFSTFNSGLKSLNNPQLQDTLVKTAGAPISKLPPQIKNIAEQALSDATKTSAIVATIFLLLGLIATFRIHKSRTD
jgi:mannitol-1-phosphate/altronate dehydrogenase